MQSSEYPPVRFERARLTLRHRAADDLRYNRRAARSERPNRRYSVTREIPSALDIASPVAPARAALSMRCTSAS